MEVDSELLLNCSDSQRRWSAEVSRHSHALDLEPGVFTWKDPRRIAVSLLQSADHSQRRKRSSFASAMAMLCFYINRAGTRLDPAQRLVLERAKQELRQLATRRTGSQVSRPAAGGALPRKT
jgi:hypothetical protein